MEKLGFNTLCFTFNNNKKDSQKTRHKHLVTWFTLMLLQDTFFYNLQVMNHFMVMKQKVLEFFLGLERNRLPLG